MMSLKKQLFTPNALEKFLNDENSCISLVSATRILALPPFFLNDMKSGVFYLLNNMLKKYDRSLDGIVVGYQNIKILIDENTGIIPIGTSETEVNISVDFYIFQPKIGNHLEGVVNKKSTSHIGCLVHQYFNATILKPEDVDYEDWICKNFNVDDKIVFKVKNLDFTGLLPFIEGVIDDEKLLEKVKSCVNNSNITENEPSVVRDCVNGIKDSDEVLDEETGCKINEDNLTNDKSINKSSSLGSIVNRNETEDSFSEQSQKKKKKKSQDKEKKLLSPDIQEKLVTVTEEASIPQKKKKKSKKKDEDKEKTIENNTQKSSNEEGKLDQCSLILQEIKNRFMKTMLGNETNESVSHKPSKTEDKPKDINSDSLVTQANDALQEENKSKEKKKKKSSKKEKEIEVEKEKEEEQKTVNESDYLKEIIIEKFLSGIVYDGDPIKGGSSNELLKEEQKKDKKKKKNKNKNEEKICTDATDTTETDTYEKEKKKSKKQDVSNDSAGKLNGIVNVEESNSLATRVPLNQIEGNKKEKAEPDKKKKKLKSKEDSHSEIESASGTHSDQCSRILQQMKHLLDIGQSNKKQAIVDKLKATIEEETPEEKTENTVNPSSTTFQVKQREEKKKKKSSKKEAVNPVDIETKKEEISEKGINGIAEAHELVGTINESHRSKKESKRKKNKEEEDQLDKSGHDNILYSTHIEPVPTKHMRISFCSPIPTVTPIRATENSETPTRQTNVGDEEKKSEKEEKTERKRKKQNSDSSASKKRKTEKGDKVETKSTVQSMLDELRQDMLNSIRQRFNLSSAKS